MNLFTIAPHKPFLQQLAQSWLAGDLGVAGSQDPLARLDTTFYLPTRRAARAFADILTDQLGGTALLPTIRTLADADEDEFLAPDGVEDDRLALPDEHLEPPNLATMPGLKRRLILTRLVQAAGQAMRRAMGELSGGEGQDAISFPQSASEAAYLAKILGELIDQVETEECDWTQLNTLIPQDYAAYWQLTLTLMTLVTQNWPDILAADGVVDPATRRRLLLDARTARITAGLHDGPVIAAGSTGSIPATARLLKAIAQYNHGAVVLPGLDLSMGDKPFARLTEDTPEAASHPQHGLANLLTFMQTSRADVSELAGPPPERQKLVSAALLPADDTASWTQARPRQTQAFDTVTVLEAASESEESLAIAMALKVALAKGQTAAVVTPDRTLARRIQLDAQRFDITIDDSAGTPLRETPPARLMVLAAQAWESGFAALDLLALLKHPLTTLGQSQGQTRTDARLLERLALRGLAVAPGLDPLRLLIHQRARDRDDPKVRIPAIRAQLGPADDARALALLDKVQAAFAPLATLEGEPLHLSTYADALYQTCEALCVGQDATQPNALYAGSGGEGVATLRTELAAATSTSDADLTLEPRDARSLFEAFLADRVVRPAQPSDPRVHIWGPLEARLQSVDHIILAGLNEATWPALPSASPLLSRSMMAGIDLAVPERRIGLSAHDVEQALGQATVTLSRATKVDGAPTVASRWLQRLLAFLPEDTGAAMKALGEGLLATARHWDTPDHTIARERPEPRPANPPTRLSITDVETLIRDPYTVYAKKVLRLEEAPGLGLPPGPAERGTLFHALFEALCTDLDTKPPQDWPAALKAHAATLLDSLAPFPDVQALWTQRIARIAPHYLAQEEDWADGLDKRMAEVSGGLDLPIGAHACRLTGRADRIDLYADGTAAILDFKTGQAKTPSQMKTFAPQLPLTAAMLARSAFADVPPWPTQRAQYVLATGKREPFEVKGLTKQEEIAEAADNALEQLTHLWATFLAGAPFVPMVRPEKASAQGPYHHLARLKEWRTADEADGDAQ